MSGWRPAMLIAVLLGLLAWVWITDRPSPAYPHGQFGPLLLLAGLVVAVAGVGISYWRSLRITARHQASGRAEPSPPADRPLE
jgi:hypothetical protein